MSPSEVTLNNRFFTLTQTRQNGRLRLSTQNIPLAMVYSVHRAWAGGLWEGDKLIGIIKQRESQTLNQGTHVVGKAVSYDAAGQAIGEAIVPLNLGLLGLAKKCNHTIEIVPDLEQDTLTLTKRRMDTTGPREDASKAIYYLSYKASRKLEATGIKLEQVRDIRLERDGAGRSVIRLTYEKNKPTATAPTASLYLPLNELRDGFNRPLLGNDWLRLSRPEDLYQAGGNEPYTEETGKFAPRIEKIGGVHLLTMHKVETETHPLTAEAKKVLQGLPRGKDGQFRVKIFPSTVAAVAVVETPCGERKEVPINSANHVPRCRLTWQGWEDMFEPRLSHVKNGQTTTAIGPQVRLGNYGDLSLRYPRDIYFYGTRCLADYSTTEKLGTDHALDRGKAMNYEEAEMTSRAGGIHSGRSQVTPYELIYNPMYFTLLEANGSHYRKLASDDQWISGPGVRKISRRNSTTAKTEIQCTSITRTRSAPPPT